MYASSDRMKPHQQPGEVEIDPGPRPSNTITSVDSAQSLSENAIVDDDASHDTSESLDTNVLMSLSTLDQLVIPSTFDIGNIEMNIDDPNVIPSELSNIDLNDYEDERIFNPTGTNHSLSIHPQTQQNDDSYWNDYDFIPGGQPLQESQQNTNNISDINNNSVTSLSQSQPYPSLPPLSLSFPKSRPANANLRSPPLPVINSTLASMGQGSVILIKPTTPEVQNHQR